MIHTKLLGILLVTIGANDTYFTGTGTASTKRYITELMAFHSVV